jgi:ELWxxDGT repeat protein
MRQLHSALVVGTAALATALSAQEIVQEPGASAAPYLVSNINPRGSSDPAEFVRFRGATYFRANDGAAGAELWRTDGTAEGTTLVSDIAGGETSSAPSEMTRFGGRLYLVASHPKTGREVWSTNGTADGTTLLADINPGPADANPSLFFPFGRTLLFRALNKSGLELWRTSGAAANTAMVREIHPGPEGSVPTFPVEFRRHVFFAADDKFTPGIGFNRELWRTDGTPRGTVTVRDINPGPGPSIPSEITRLGSVLIFKAGNSEIGQELWMSDGTARGTVPLKDIVPGPASSFPSNLERSGSQVFFMADDGKTGRELWKTDGTVEGTVRVKDINPGPADSSPMGVAFRDGYLFNAGDASSGRELWFSNGTEEGTVLVKDINPGQGLSSPLALTVAGDEAYFAALQQEQADGSVVTELWKTDGTERGTVAVFEAPGRFNGYSIRNLAVSGRNLYFAAPTDVDAEGRSADFELYAVRLGGRAVQPEAAEAADTVQQ